MVVAGAGGALGCRVTLGAVAFCAGGVVLGDGAPGLATGVDHRPFCFSAAFEGDWFGWLLAAGAGAGLVRCCTIG